MPRRAVSCRSLFAILIAAFAIMLSSGYVKHSLLQNGDTTSHHIHLESDLSSNKTNERDPLC